MTAVAVAGALKSCLVVMASKTGCTKIMRMITRRAILVITCLRVAYFADSVIYGVTVSGPVWTGIFKESRGLCGYSSAYILIPYNRTGRPVWRFNRIPYKLAFCYRISSIARDHACGHCPLNRNRVCGIPADLIIK
jgi:hypothetical protein